LTREKIEEWLEDRELAVLLADGLDDAFIGVDVTGEEPRAVYSIDDCIRVLSEDMDAEDAEEYFWFNVAGAHVGPRTPLFIQTL
jgi:hypothetical protein